MSTQRRRGLQGEGPAKPPTVDKYPARRFPIQHEIQKLEDELNAFNERIAELEDEGHRGHAMKVLRADAIDLARRIDELRSLLAEPTKRGRSPQAALSDALRLSLFLDLSRERLARQSSASAGSWHRSR
jgi:predicted nuclease with TOPRIM domain